VIERVHAAALEGRQVYWVCPLIEESEALQLQTATETYETLAEALPDLVVGLVHGRMKPAEKQVMMDAFTAGEVHVLVATTVIEVGVDVPNASLMVIEHAERFGLSQLHQLRGRVGRGSAASVCLLLYQSPLGQVAKQRLMTMRETTDGFRDRAPRPGDPRARRIPGRAPVGRGDAALRQPGDRPVARRAGARRRGLAAGVEKPEAEAIVDAHLARWLGGREEFLKVSAFAAAFASVLASFASVFATCASCLASAFAGAAAVAAGAGVWAKAAVANRPTIRVAMVFFMIKASA
jgi:ATP-dependent DNA helicase RecG